MWQSVEFPEFCNLQLSSIDREGNVSKAGLCQVRSQRRRWRRKRRTGGDDQTRMMYQSSAAADMTAVLRGTLYRFKCLGFH